MTLILSGTNGVSDIDGDASTPAVRGTDANTGIFFGSDVIGFSEGGTECARFNADAQFVAAAGTASLPVLTTTGDVNTGIYFPAADNIGFATGGTIRGRWTTDGLCFGSDTAAANALDDYEEGTWTPVLSDAISGGNTSPTAATSATYTKVGRIVTVQCAFINIDTTGMTGANNLHIQDFPFAPVSVSGTAYIPGAVVLTNTTFTGYIQSTIADNATWGRFPSISSGGSLSFVTVSELTSGSADLYLSLTYSAA